MSSQNANDNENNLIGNILKEDDDSDDDREPNSAMVNKHSWLSLMRTGSAPLDDLNQTATADEEFRTKPEYIDFYYKERATNPRLPKPIITGSSNWKNGGESRTGFGPGDEEAGNTQENPNFGLGLQGDDSHVVKQENLTGEEDDEDIDLQNLPNQFESINLGEHENQFGSLEDQVYPGENLQKTSHEGMHGVNPNQRINTNSAAYHHGGGSGAGAGSGRQGGQNMHVDRRKGGHGGMGGNQGLGGVSLAGSNMMGYGAGGYGYEQMKPYNQVMNPNQMMGMPRMDQLGLFGFGSTMYPQDPTGSQLYYGMGGADLKMNAPFSNPSSDLMMSGGVPFGKMPMSGNAANAGGSKNPQGMMGSPHGMMGVMGNSGMNNTVGFGMYGLGGNQMPTNSMTGVPGMNMMGSNPSMGNVMSTGGQGNLGMHNKGARRTQQGGGGGGNLGSGINHNQDRQYSRHGDAGQGGRFNTGGNVGQGGHKSMQMGGNNPGMGGGLYNANMGSQMQQSQGSNFNNFQDRQQGKMSGRGYNNGNSQKGMSHGMGTGAGNSTGGGLGHQGAGGYRTGNGNMNNGGNMGGNGNNKMKQQQQQDGGMQFQNYPGNSRGGNGNTMGGGLNAGNQNAGVNPGAGAAGSAGAGAGGKNVPRSRLLEDFRNRSNNKKFELSELKGHIIEFSKDQLGSRLIQQKFETASDEEKSLVFEEILDSSLELMSDVFGNYVIQKILEYGSEPQKRAIADQLMGRVYDLSLHMYGCRVVQKAIEVIDSEQQSLLVFELKGKVMDCVKDQNGNHVIQKCVEKIQGNTIQFIVDAFINRVSEMASHPYGCRVIQRILEFCEAEQVRPIMQEIMRNVPALTRDQYGNYVIQHVLEHGTSDDRMDIFKTFHGKLVELSQHKFASNVVERCIKEATGREKQAITHELLSPTADGSTTVLVAMANDKYGNYVIQRAIEAHDDMRFSIYQSLKEQASALKKSSYGRHIIGSLEKYFGKMN